MWNQMCHMSFSWCYLVDSSPWTRESQLTALLNRVCTIYSQRDSQAYHPEKLFSDWLTNFWLFWYQMYHSGSKRAEFTKVWRPEYCQKFEPRRGLFSHDMRNVIYVERIVWGRWTHFKIKLHFTFSGKCSSISSWSFSWIPGFMDNSYARNAIAVEVVSYPVLIEMNITDHKVF